VSAFLFGNGVETSFAAACYAAFNIRGNTLEIIETVYDWYFKWEKRTREEHLASYYNMCTCSVTWINGKELDKEEEVESKVSVPEMGVECMKSINPEKWSTLKRAIRGGSLRGVMNVQWKFTMSQREWIDVQSQAY
jgi:hypothetical protein